MEIGRIHMQAGGARKAFPYFQRVNVMYAGFREQAAEAYLESGRELEQLGDKVAAARTYIELLDRSEDFAAAAPDALAKTRARLDALPAEAVEGARQEILREAEEAKIKKEAA